MTRPRSDGTLLPPRPSLTKIQTQNGAFLTKIQTGKAPVLTKIQKFRLPGRKKPGKIRDQTPPQPRRSGRPGRVPPPKRKPVCLTSCRFHRRRLERRFQASNGAGSFPLQTASKMPGPSSFPLRTDRTGNPKSGRKGKNRGRTFGPAPARRTNEPFTAPESGGCRSARSGTDTAAPR